MNNLADIFAQRVYANIVKTADGLTKLQTNHPEMQSKISPIIDSAMAIGANFKGYHKINQQRFQSLETYLQIFIGLVKKDSEQINLLTGQVDSLTLEVSQLKFQVVNLEDAASKLTADCATLLKEKFPHTDDDAAE